MLLSADLARALVTLRADDETQARYDELADKNSQGALSTDEARELEAIVRANTFLGILKAQAQAPLNPSSPNGWMRRRGNSSANARGTAASIAGCPNGTLP